MLPDARRQIARGANKSVPNGLFVMM